MARRPDKMKLGAMVSATGIHFAAWRHPDAQTDGPSYQEMEPL